MAGILANELQRLKLESGLSYAQLSSKTGISRSTIIRWCGGDRPDPANLKKLLVALRASKKDTLTCWAHLESPKSVAEVQKVVPSFRTAQGSVLRSLRIMKRRSVHELADQLGKHESVIRRYESGHVRISNDDLRIIVSSLNLTNAESEALLEAPATARSLFTELSDFKSPPDVEVIFRDDDQYVSIYEFFSCWPILMLKGAISPPWADFAQLCATRMTNALMYSNNEALAIDWASTQRSYFSKIIPGSGCIALSVGLEDIYSTRRYKSANRSNRSRQIRKLQQGIENVQTPHRSWLQRRLSRHLAAQGTITEAWRVFELSCIETDWMGELEESAWRALIYESMGEYEVALELYANCLEMPSIPEGNLVTCITALELALKKGLHTDSHYWRHALESEIRRTSQIPNLRQHSTFALDCLNSIISQYNSH